MDNAVVRGDVLRGYVIEVPNELGRKLRRLANGAKLCLDRHSKRMNTDSEYREVVEHLTKLLSELPGRVGQTLRIVSAGHDLMVKVL